MPDTKNPNDEKPDKPPETDTPEPSDKRERLAKLAAASGGRIRDRTGEPLVMIRVGGFRIPPKEDK